jgi:DNA-binding transcriptional regulator/RsmH inhibitor MraZ
MELNGMEFYSMLAFCGQDPCSIDANGRIKLSPRFIADFQSRCSGEVVMHCLPEGAVALYPEEIYLKMREEVTNPASKVAVNLAYRRTMRRFGAMSRSEKISAQGRVTLPAGFREYAELAPGADAIVVGAEIGVEIWNAERWQAEILKVDEHFHEKGARQMTNDLEIDTEETMSRN